ncbi:MAG: FAD-binding oxidoreductase [Betaproteobacteria bacterium]|nr:FAD-binding oxidoreductase [Betaproteobacteria bacterium]MDO7705216.1 FAD-binding oxidoreductase [Burkholderiaceae bacterium]
MNTPAPTIDLPAFLNSLRHIVGEANVLTDGDLSAWTHDWRKRVQGKALTVVRPATTEEVAAVVRTCDAHATAIVPQGGNTGLVLGSVPDESGTQVLLSLSRMNRIRQIDSDNLTVTVEAGCVLQALQNAVAEKGLYFPLSLAAEGSCTIGGNLATNAGGTQVLRFGNTRDLCLGLEVVTAEGTIWDGLSGLRKDNTGYDLRNLLIGSEGTLGVITAATMKLYPQPTSRSVAWLHVNQLDDAVQVLGHARRLLSDGLTGFEVMGAFARSLVVKHFPQLNMPLHEVAPEAPYAILLEYASADDDATTQDRLEQVVGEAIEKGWVTDAVLAAQLSQAATMWQIREHISLAQSQEGLNIKHDISIPISRIAAFVAHTDHALAQAIPGVRLVNFGHLGDGNLHYNVQAPLGVDAATFLETQEVRINTVVFDAVLSFGGSISAEHGIGSLKAETLPHYKSPVALRMMRQIKTALDPKNLFNPGRVLPRSVEAGHE